MTFVGTSSVSSLVHLCAKLPRTAIAFTFMGLSLFIVHHFHKEQYVKKEVMIEVQTFEKDAEIGSCMIHKCTQVGNPNVTLREASHHTGASNAPQAIAVSNNHLAAVPGKKPVAKTDTVERP